MNKDGYIIGIDLGTTNSCASVTINGKVTVIPSPDGGNTIASVWMEKDSGEIVVGAPAKRGATLFPLNTIVGQKRLIGRSYDDAMKKIQAHPVSYKIIKAANGDAAIEIVSGGNKKQYSIQEGSAKVLAAIKKYAESYLGTTVSRAVITVPAYFDDTQRQATKDAGRIAGLEVERIINEPTAAALAYGLDKASNETIVVYDLGGGTFDVSVVSIADGVVEVLSTSGDAFLGGEDFDNVIIDYLLEEFNKQNNLNINKTNTDVIQRLKEAAEKAKIELSSVLEAEVSLPFLAQGADGQAKHLQLRFSRSKLEELTLSIINKTKPICMKAIEGANIKASEVRKVLLVGGQTRMPRVQQFVKETFTNANIEKSVNPDEVVAIGAAVQAGILQGDIKDIVLLDVTPLSLGIETMGGVFTKIIDANTTIPTSKSQVFSTAMDNQTSVSIVIAQGERPMARDNKMLGTFNLDGIPPAPRGVPQIEVKFDLDANGILHVSASEKASGKEQKITISGSGGLTEEEIERMRKEAAQYAEEDQKRLSMVESRNKAESAVNTAESTMKEHKEKLSPELIASIEEKIKAVRETLSNLEKSKEDIDSVTDALQSETSKVYEEISKASASATDNNTTEEGA